jgi:hypothetical protein
VAPSWSPNTQPSVTAVNVFPRDASQFKSLFTLLNRPLEYGSKLLEGVLGRWKLRETNGPNGRWIWEEEEEDEEDEERCCRVPN